MENKVFQLNANHPVPHSSGYIVKTFQYMGGGGLCTVRFKVDQLVLYKGVGLVPRPLQGPLSANR